MTKNTATEQPDTSAKLPTIYIGNSVVKGRKPCLIFRTSRLCLRKEKTFRRLDISVPSGTVGVGAQLLGSVGVGSDCCKNKK